MLGRKSFARGEVVFSYYLHRREGVFLKGMGSYFTERGGKQSVGRVGVS